VSLTFRRDDLAIVADLDDIALERLTGQTVAEIESGPGRKITMADRLTMFVRLEMAAMRMPRSAPAISSSSRKSPRDTPLARPF
jgi:hypothetical protein